MPILTTLGVILFMVGLTMVLGRWTARSAVGGTTTIRGRHRIRHDPHQPTKETDMGEHTDKIRGRVKQAIGALTGNHDLKREGERQERKGEVKGHIDDAVDKAKDTADDVKDKIVKAVDKA